MKILLSVPGILHETKIEGSFADCRGHDEGNREAMLDALVAPAANHMSASRDYGSVSNIDIAPTTMYQIQLCSRLFDVISPVSHEVTDHMQKKKTLMPLGKGLSSDTGKQHKVNTAERLTRGHLRTYSENCL